MKALDALGIGPHLRTAAAIFLLVASLFAALERAMSTAAKRDLTKYLRSASFIIVANRLPRGTKGVFDYLFGGHHISFKCIRRSIIFSVSSIILLLVFGFLTHYDYFYTMPAFMWSHPGFTVGYVSYITASLFVDYINLFKTRAIINIFSSSNLGIGALSLVVFIDIFLSYVVFSSLYGFASYVNVMYQIAIILDHGGARHFIDLVDSNIFLYRYHYLDEYVRLAGRVLYGPAADETTVLFYAGLVPSFWLWLYFFSAMISRFVVQCGPGLKLLVYILDVDKHPVKSVGYVAATLSIFVYIVSRIL